MKYIGKRMQRIMRKPRSYMQDGILSYYLSQAKIADANVEKRIDKEPFDFRDFIKTIPELRDSKRK